MNDGTVSSQLTSDIEQQEELMSSLQQKEQKLKVSCTSLSSQHTILNSSLNG
jgi:hypothetical protein